MHSDALVKSECFARSADVHSVVFWRAWADPRNHEPRFGFSMMCQFLSDGLSIRRLPLQRPNRCQTVARTSGERVQEPARTLVEASKLADAPDLKLKF
jgi:hypothetical protein